MFKNTLFFVWCDVCTPGPFPSLFGEFFLPACYRKCPSKQPDLSKIKSISRSFQLWLALFSVWFKSHLNDLELEYIFLALFRRHESFAAVCCRWCVRSGWIIATVWDKAGYRSIAFTRIRFSLFDKQKKGKSEHQEVGNSLKYILVFNTLSQSFMCSGKRRRCGVCLV